MKKMRNILAVTLAAIMAYESAGVPLAQASFLSPQSAVPNASRPGAKPDIQSNLESLSATLSTKTQFAIPSTIGQVVEIHAPSKAGRMVYHLQDVHGHIPAQTNLSEMVTLLESHAEAQGKALLVAIEGADKDINTDAISGLNLSREQKADVAAGLLRSGFLFGEEYAAILKNVGRIKIVGIETPSLYRDNVAAKSASSVSRERILITVRETRQILEKLKVHNFNPKLVALERNRLAVEAGDMGTPEYLDFLYKTGSAAARKHENVMRLIRVSQMEKGIDFAKVERESQMLIAEVLKGRSDREVEGMVREAMALKDGQLSPLIYYGNLMSRSNRLYPTLQSYMAYLRESSKVDAEALFDEIQILENEVAEDLCPNPVSYALYEALRWIERQERFFSLKMIPQEWDKQKNDDLAAIYQSHRDIRAFVEEQTADLGYKFGVPLFAMADLKTAVAGAGGFYRAAEARDNAMMSNLSKLMARYPEDKYVVALVAGGFHTPGLTHLMKKQGFAYNVIRPQLESPIALSEKYTFPTYVQNVPEEDLSPKAAKFLRATPGFAEVTDAQVRQIFTNPTKARLPQPSRARPMVAYSVAAPTVLLALFADMDPNATALATIDLGSFGIGLIVGILTLAAIQWAIRKVAHARAQRAAQVVAQPEPVAVPPTIEQRLELARQMLLEFDPNLPEYDQRYYLSMLYQRWVPGSKQDPQFMTNRAVANGNFILDATMTQGEREGWMAIIDYADAMLGGSLDEALLKTVTVKVNLMDAGLGENFARAIYKLTSRADVTGLRASAGIEAKGTDLVVPFYPKDPATGKPVARRATIAEIKLLQIIRIAQSGIFGNITYQPLVNTQSRVSYEALLKAPYLYDLIDSSRTGAPRTYGEVLGAGFAGFHLQNNLPGVNKETNMPGRDKGVPNQPGGHGQFSFFFFFEAIRLFGQVAKGAAQATVRVFVNGDNVSTRPDPRIIQNMVKNNHVAYMLVTPAQEIDKKGGKLGVSIIKVGDKTYYVPDMIEKAQADHAGQLEDFYGAGQPGGIGEENKQSFNTNALYLNEPLLGRILYKLAMVLGEGNYDKGLIALGRVINPTLIDKDAKVGADGQKYIPIDGAIGSALLNLNRFFLLNKEDSAIGGILDDEGIDRILHLVNIPIERRSEHFTPNKTPPDHYLYVRTDRFTLNPDTLAFDDNFSDRPLPVFEFPVGKEEGAEFWKDLQTFYDALGYLTIRDLNGLEVKGSVAFPDAVLKGRVRITSNVPYKGDVRSVPNLMAARYAAQLPRQTVTTPEGVTKEVLILENVDIVIDANGNLTVTPIAPVQPISVGEGWVALTASLLLTGGLVAFALPAMPILSMIFVAWFSAVVVVAALIVGVARFFVNAAPVNGTQTLDNVRNNRANYSADRVSQLERLAAAAQYVAKGSFDVAVESGKLADTGYDASANPNRLAVGSGLLSNSRAGDGSFIGGVIQAAKAAILHIAVAHEIVHLNAVAQADPRTRAGFVINEIVAWALTPFVAVVLLLAYFVDLRSPASDSSKLASSVSARAAVPVGPADQIVSAVKQAAAPKAGRPAAAPRLIAVDVASLLRDADGADAGALMVEALRAAQNLGRQIASEGVQTQVIFYNTDPAFAGIEETLSRALGAPELGFTATFVGQSRLGSWDKELDSLLRIANVNGASFAPANVFAIQRNGTEDGIRAANVVGVNNIVHFSVSLAVYSRSLDPQTVVSTIIEILGRQNNKILEDVLLQNAAEILASIAA